MLYLDNAATTPMSQELKDYIVSLLDTYGNPSSIYTTGRKAKALIDDARLDVANFVSAGTDEIFFTPGGSASNTIGIKGYCTKNNCNILYSPIAHKSIIKCVESCGNSMELKVDNNGAIDLKDLEQKCIMNPCSLVVIDYANSEIGVVQEVKKIIEIAHFYKNVVYLDCTASISSIPLNVKDLDVDMCGFSGHKLGALKGCGVFFKKRDISVEPLVYGVQEDGIIGGTENVIGIASLGMVVRNYDYGSVSSAGRDWVYDYIHKNISDTYLVGDIKNRLDHNLYICFKNIDGESLVLLMDMNGIQLSTGSACNSESLEPSPVLKAIGFNPDDIYSCVRMTFSGNERCEELQYLCSKLKECVAHLRNFQN